MSDVHASHSSTLLAVTVLSALPTPQNIFVVAMRYDRQVTLARDSIPAVILIVVVLIALAARFAD